MDVLTDPLNFEEMRIVREMVESFWERSGGHSNLSVVAWNDGSNLDQVAVRVLSMRYSNGQPRQDGAAESISASINSNISRVGADAYCDTEASRFACVDFPRFRDVVVRPAYQGALPMRIHRDLARDLLEMSSSRRIEFSRIVRNQVAEIAQRGMFRLPNGRHMIVPVRLLQVLVALARPMPVPPRHRHSFYVLSLLRPRDSDSGHSRGHGIDITWYDGYQLNMVTPDDAYVGTISLLRSLPAGRYFLGVPREPRILVTTTNRSGVTQESIVDYQKYRHFFFEENLDAQGRPVFRPEFADPNNPGLFRPQGGPLPLLRGGLSIRRSPSRRGISRDLEYFDNPAHRLEWEHELMDAGRRGVRIDFLVPDEPNHVHLELMSSEMPRERRPRPEPRDRRSSRR
jgi:hypothetical protein